MFLIDDKYNALETFKSTKKKRLKKQLERNIKIVKFDYGGEYGGKYDELIVIWGFLPNTFRNLKF